MLAAVDFYDQLFSHADEVHNVAADGLLPAEFVPTELVLAQVMPEKPFRVASGLAEGFCAFEG